MVAAERHYDGVAEIDSSDIEADFGRVGFDPASDCVLMFEGDDAVAWAQVYRDTAEADVHPSHHRRGIGRTLLGWTERRARELGAVRIDQTVTDHNRDAPVLFLASGYEPSWTSWVLEIAFDEPPPEHRTPDGITIRRFHPQHDAEATHRLIEDAFGEWEGWTGYSFEEWSAFIMGHSAFSPAMSRLAWDEDELVGAALAFDYDAEEEGWVQQLATKATHRRRGIARALLHETFRAFYQRGKARCGLATDSRTGTLSLYERVGMRVRRSYTNYGKSLT